MNAAAERWFSDKRVTVLGASGFLGSHLVRRLVPLCGSVVSFSRGSATGSLDALAGSEIVLGDLRVPTDVKKAIAGSSVVFSFAGKSGAIGSVAQALADLETNVGGIVNVLDAARAMPEPPKVIFPGSRLQYGRVSVTPTPESAPQLPLSPYGLHKKFCEEYLAYHARLHGVPYVVARLTNPYGAHGLRYAFGYNVLNQMIVAAIAGKPLTIFGDGRQLRDYIFIDDAIDALLLLAGTASNVCVNVGSGEPTEFRNAAEIIVRLAGRGKTRSAAWPADALAVETGDFVADISLARSHGWSPRFSFEAGVRETITRLGG